MLRRHAFRLTFAACLVASLLPLFASRVLPFHDASGLIGLGGALAHQNEPAARIGAFFDIRPGAYPSALYFGWAYLAARLHVPMDIAFSLFTGLFCLAAPPLAMLALLRAFGRPRSLALLAFPITYHQQIWFGFVGSAAAVAGIILALALAKDAADRPRPGNHLALAATILFVASAHPFSFALLGLLLLPFVLWPARSEGGPEGGRATRPGLRALALRLLCAVPALLFLAPWLGGFFTRSGDSQPFWTRALHELTLDRPRPKFSGGLFLQWLGNGYLTVADEIVPAVAIAVLLAFLVLGARPEAGARRECDRHGWIWLSWAALCLALAFLLLPNQIFWPERWWGVRVRCVVPLFLIAVAAVRPSARGLPAWVAAPSVAAALIFAGYVTWDLRTHWHHQVLAGFDEVMAALPPGQSVLAMPALPDDHYTNGHPYLVQHYVAWTGGRAVPFLRGHATSYWVTQKEPPPAPPWGDRGAFVWRDHGPGYDYFLVELPLHRAAHRAANDPLEHAPGNEVTLVAARGQWRLYARVAAAR